MSRHTDESWFLHFHQEGEITSTTAVGERFRLPMVKAVVSTCRGEPIVMIEQCGPSGPNGLGISKQFKENVRVMAAAREMLRVLKHLADELDHGELPDAEAKMIWDAIAAAEPPLFNVYEQHFKTGYKHHRFTGTNDECFNYILQHQGQSVDYALKQGGWKIESV